MNERLEEAARGALYILQWHISMMEDGHIKVTLDGHEGTNECHSQFLRAAGALEAALSDLPPDADHEG